MGCGGYHMWRMIGAGASGGRYRSTSCSCASLKRLRSCSVTTSGRILPLGIEQLLRLEAFDTVFSMGVLYRRSPLDHLWRLKDQLAPGASWC